MFLAFRQFDSGSHDGAWRRHHEAGRLALHRALEAAGREGTVAADPTHGFLELRDGRGHPIPGCFLNVSHTEGLAVGVVGEGPLGVDVERLDRDPTRALERFLSQADRKNLADFRDQRVRGELLLWTAKEAFGKALGLGVQAGMTTLEIDLTGPVPLVARTPRPGRFTLIEPRIHWEIRGEFLVTLCAEASALRGGITRIPG